MKKRENVSDAVIRRLPRYFRYLNDLRNKGVVRISGSGDVRVKEIYGELDVKISGSGDLTCAGELDKLVFVAGGSGDLKGKNLTVKDAELHTTGASSISIGRITGCSREKFSKSTSVKIGKRG